MLKVLSPRARKVRSTDMFLEVVRIHHRREPQHRRQASRSSDSGSQLCCVSVLFGTAPISPPAAHRQVVLGHRHAVGIPLDGLLDLEV
jgi:hypothetical protein